MSDSEEHFHRPLHIKYGAIISISHFQDDNAFVFANGHVKRDVSLKSFSLYKKAEELRIQEKLRKKLVKQNKHHQQHRVHHQKIQFREDNEEQEQSDQEEEEIVDIGQDEQDQVETSGIREVRVNHLNKNQRNESPGSPDNHPHSDRSNSHSHSDRSNNHDTNYGLLDVQKHNEDNNSINRDIPQQQDLESDNNINNNNNPFNQTIQEDPEIKKKKDVNQNKQSFADCLFMIFPKLSNNQKNKIIETLKHESEESENEQDDAESIFDNQYDVNSKDVAKASAEAETNDTDILERENLDKLKIHLLNEYKANYDTFKKSRESTVAYNSAIQLLHLASAKWLSLKPIEAKYEKENFRMTLEATTNDNTMFKILPAFRHQKDGEQAIFASEIVYIARYQDINNRPTFLNISPEIRTLKSLVTTSFEKTSTKNSNNQFTPQLSEQYQQAMNKEFRKQQHQSKAISSTIDPIYKREVNGSQESSTNFKLNLFQENYTEVYQYLKCGDVLWLHHSEANGQIGATRKDKGVNKFTFASMNLKTWMAKDNLDLKVIGTHRQSIYEHYSGNTFGMWQIESQKLSDGGFVEYSQLYRLKHLSTGFFLSVQRKPSQEKMQSSDLNDYFQLGLVEIPDGSSLFQFDCLPSLKQKSPFISLNSYVFIQNVKYKYYIDVKVDEMEIQKFGTKFQQLSLPSLRTNLSEQLLFKVYSADKNEVWEINYVISCFGYLVKLALALEDRVVETKSDEKLMFSLVRKIKKTIKCVINLTKFCENKVYNMSQQQKFGTSNPFRQKLLREQYFIDLLVKVLESSLPKHELDVWIKSQDALKVQQSTLHQRNKSDQTKQFGTFPKSENSTQDFFLRGGDSFIDANEYAAYINWKVTMCRFIYKLLEAICRGNPSNQQYTFDLLPFFQIHSKYIPQAVDCISNICSSNEQLLMRLSDNLQIEYDFNDDFYVKEDMSKTVKFLINLYDGNPTTYQQNKEEKIVFAQHEKLTCKPINLVNFFVNLLWDNKAVNKSDYMRFLRSICTFKHKGITINQENIFKLFKKFSSVKEELKLEIQFVDGTIQKPTNPKELQSACEHILLLSNLSFGRNFLWRKELMNKFRSDDLFKFIWDQQLEQGLTSALCKLAQTLYIDHEPLNKIYRPNYCRLFCDVPYRKKKGVPSPTNKAQTPIRWEQDGGLEKQKLLTTEEADSYTKLLSNLKAFIAQVSQQIEEEIIKFTPERSVEANDNADSHQPFAQNKAKNNNIPPKSSAKPRNITGSEVLKAIIDLLNLLLQLDVYTITAREQDFSELLQFLLRILQYERIGIKFMSALFISEKESLEKNKQSQKTVDITKLTSGLCSGVTAFFTLITDMLQPKKPEAEEEEGGNNVFEFRSIDDTMLFKNPIMKGYVKLNNLMEEIMYSDNESIQMENQIKAKVCQILDHLLCIRQDYLLSNTLYFFKKTINGENSKSIRKKFEIHKKNQSLGKKSNLSILQGDSEKLDDAAGDADTQQLLDNLEKPVLFEKRSRADSQTPLNQQTQVVPLRNQVSKKSAFRNQGKPSIIKDNSKDNTANNAKDVKAGGTGGLGSSFSAAIQNGENNNNNNNTTGRLSLFGGKTTKTIIANISIDEQFTEWWIKTLKDLKKKTILPQIALTGLPEVDKLYKESDELGVFKLTDENIHPKFHDYLKDAKHFMPDFDILLSAALKKVKADSKTTVVASALPPLICTFLLVQDQHLEVQVLNIIMRLFNQRSEMLQNLEEMQIIFDQKNIELFKFLKIKSIVLQNYIQKSEIWFQTVERVSAPGGVSQLSSPKNQNIILSNNNDSDSVLSEIPILQNKSDNNISRPNAPKKTIFVEKDHDAYKIFKLIESIRNGLFAEITLNPNQDEFGQSVTRNSTQIDVEKQKIHKYLKLHEPIITLIQEGMPHFDKIVMSETYTLTTKRMLYNLFKESFGYLKNFVEKNSENQVLISEFMHVLTMNLEYDLGQIDLICEIFRDNIDLINKLDPELVNLFLNLIEHEGRQEKFLDFFIVIQKAKSKMIFENQLLVLNSFLPMDGLTELEVKLTYTDGAKKTSDLQFYFEDTAADMEDQDMIARLQEVEFRDTYLDQPFRYHAKLLNSLLYSILQANVDLTDYDLAITKDHFNISVAKLKKTFSFYYLLEVLQKEDDYVDYRNYDVDEELDDSQEEGDAETQKKYKENKERLSMFKHDKEKRKQGFSYLKPYVADFIKIVHIFSDSSSSDTLFNELTFTQKEFSQFVEKEGLRFGSVVEESLEARYVFYVCVHVLGMVAAYFDKYLRKYVDKSSPDEEERRDLTKVREFAEIIAKKMKSSKRIKIDLADQYKHHFEKAKELRRMCQTTNIVDIQVEGDDFLDAMSQSLSSNDDDSQEEGDQLGLPALNLGDKNKDKGNMVASTKQPSSILKLDQKMSSIPGIGPRKEFNFKLDSPRTSVSQSQKKQDKLDELLLCEYQQMHWKQFVQAINISPFISEQVESEVKALADAILNIEQYIVPEMQRFISPKLDLDLILKKFIRFLQFSLKDGGSKRTTLTLLKVLKTIVEKDPEDIANRQDQLDKLGAAQMVLIILSEHSNELDGELYINFIEFQNTLLKGGNPRIQKTIYEFFINQPKSEIIFAKFSFFIRKQIDFIEQEMKSKKRREEEKKGKFKNINNKDGLDDGISQMMDDDEEAKEDAANESNSFTHSQDVVILESILEFLSLTVTGHYTEMQDYLREQHNLRSNNDMVQNIADLLKSYYQQGGQKQYYEPMVKCIETLLKFVQGPCPLNQLAVSESKFFDVAHDLFERAMRHKSGTDDSKSQFTSNKKSQFGGSQSMSKSAFKTQSMASRSKVGSGEEPLDNWMVARLQYKCLCLVHGLLEGRSVKSDPSLIRKIARNIQIDTIEKIIVEVYLNFDQIYLGEYTMQSLEHLNFDVSNPKHLENPFYKKNTDIFMHTIIQNAFLLYILFCLYMDSGERIDSQIMTLYKEQYRKSTQDTKSPLMKLLTGNNIIGNLVTFFMSFIESSIKTAQSMQQEAQKQMKKMTGGGNSEEEDEATRKLRQEKQEKFKENLKKTIQFLFKNTAHIEVLRNGELETIYFTLLPFCKRLPKEKKQEFNETVDRNNEKAKVTGLMQQADYILDVCRKEEDLNKFFMKNKFLSLFANYVELWKDIAFILTILLNLFNLFTFTSKFGDRFYDQHFLLDQESYSVQQTNSIVSVMGLIMTCCSMFVVAFFLAKNLPILIKRIWQTELNIFSTKPPLIFRAVLWLLKFVRIFIGLLQEIEIIYYICYGTFAILGTFAHPFFFTFHLSEIFIRFPTLKSVVQAVSIPKKNLMLTYILYLIFVYLFTLLAFEYLKYDLNEECSTLAYCFAFLIDYTFKANGGIGGYITGKNVKTDESGQRTDSDFFAAGRFFYDNLFCILIVIILVQIVAGQIIDQFGELREAENDRKDDTEGKCFICGIKSDVFDKKADKSNRGGFHSHIKENHYMWNYVFYIGYLRSMNHLEYSGIEQYIHDLIKENDSAWFPTNRSSDLDVEEDDSKREKALIESITSQTEYLSQNSKQIFKQLKEISKL